MLNLDPALLDQNKVRMKKRKHLFKVYLIPILVLLAASIFFIRVGIYNIFMSLESKSQTYSVIPALNTMQIPTNLLDPYVAYYNDGYIKMINAKSHQDLDEAINSFKESLKNDPPENMQISIYGNISYALELQADKKAEISDFDNALILYNRAEAIAREETAKNRIIEKRNRTIAAANNTIYDGEEAQGFQISDEKLKEIESIQQEVDENGRLNLRINQINN